MKNCGLLIMLLIVLSITACSFHKDISGKYKNSEGDVITISKIEDNKFLVSFSPEKTWTATLSQNVLTLQHMIPLPLVFSKDFNSFIVEGKEYIKFE